MLASNLIDPIGFKERRKIIWASHISGCHGISSFVILVDLVM
jgi:hypothetical protein